MLDNVRASEPIPGAHKMAITPIAAGQSIIKYGLPIGLASCDIQPGSHVHSHNLRTGLSAENSTTSRQLDSNRETTQRSGPLFQFEGYRRGDGRVAIRNEIWILNTVACVNQTATQLAAWANRTLVGKSPHLHGVHAFNHPFGCSQLGDDLNDTQAILAALARHPHAAGVLLIGLGCENNQLEAQLHAIGDPYRDKIRSFTSQKVTDEMETGRQMLTELADLVSAMQQETISSHELVFGMKCGGSDGLSGITGNPLLGRIADRHCASGGTTLLTEVPEMFGAEPVLLGRCVSDQVWNDANDMVQEFKEYFSSHGQPVSENPSPGNKDGGITTLEEKSLGCVQKGGTAPVCEIVSYGQQASQNLGGLSLVNGPGNDGVSITALAAAGANVILFTTGRGTPMGAPVPTVKVSTNTTLSEHKPGWIDFNAGVIADGTATLDEAADQLGQWLARLAAGTLEAKNETNGYREIAIWKSGVTL